MTKTEKPVVEEIPTMLDSFIKVLAIQPKVIQAKLDEGYIEDLRSAAAARDTRSESASDLSKSLMEECRPQRQLVAEMNIRLRGHLYSEKSGALGFKPHSPLAAALQRKVDCLIELQVVQQPPRPSRS